MVATAPVKVYVFSHPFCEAFHFGAVLKMCAADGATNRCDIIRDNSLLVPLRGSTSGVGSTFGLPVVEYGGLSVSQSVAGTIFAGELLGFAPATRGTQASDVAGTKAKAAQFMLDMRDFLDNLRMGNSGYDGTSTYSNPPPRFEELVASGRVDQFMRYFERVIAGPYFFGSGASYVDYYFVSMMAWIGAYLKQMESARAAEWRSGGSLLQNYTKVRGVLDALPMVTERIA